MPLLWARDNLVHLCVMVAHICSQGVHLVASWRSKPVTCRADAVQRVDRFHAHRIDRMMKLVLAWTQSVSAAQSATHMYKINAQTVPELTCLARSQVRPQTDGQAQVQVLAKPVYVHFKRRRVSLYIFLSLSTPTDD